MNRRFNVNLIQEYRIANKMTITEFCNKCGIATTTYNKVINGGKCWLQTMRKIAKVMNISVWDLLIED